MPSPLDPQTKVAILLVALFLTTALGGVLACVYRVPHGNLAGLTTVAATAMMVVVLAIRDPSLLPVALLGAGLVVAAGVSTARERARR